MYTKIKESSFVVKENLRIIGTQNGNRLRQILPLFAFLCVSSLAFSADETNVQEEKATPQENIIEQQAEEHVGPVQPLDELVDTEVRNAAGESIGSVVDFLVEQQNERIRYAILSVGGFLGLGDTQYAIPWNKLKYNANELYFVLDITEERLKNAPGQIEETDWQDSMDQRWHETLLTYYDVEKEEIGSVYGTNNIIGQEVKNNVAEDLGTVQNLMVNLNDGKIDYVMVESDTGTGTSNLIPVPLKALQKSPDKNYLVLDVSKEDLKNAPQLEGLDVANLQSKSKSWMEEIYEFYNVSDSSNSMQVVTSNKITGFSVKNPAGEDLGTIDDLGIDIQQGKISFAILSFGGFLGIGDEVYAISWESLKFDSGKQSFILDVTKEQLQNAPQFDHENWSAQTDPEQKSNIWKYSLRMPQ